MQARIVVSKVMNLEILDRLDDDGRDQMHAILDIAERLERIEQQGSGCPEQCGGFACNAAAIGKLDGSSRLTRCLCLCKRCGDYRAVCFGNAGLVHKELDFIYTIVACKTLAHSAAFCIITAQDLLLGSFTADGIVNNAVARHVYAHVGRRFIGAASIDLFENCGENRENFNIAVVIHRGDAIGFEMEGVDHVHVV